MASNSDPGSTRPARASPAGAARARGAVVVPPPQPPRRAPGLRVRRGARALARGTEQSAREASSSKEAAARARENCIPTNDYDCCKGIKLDLH